jgi:hypothetical protein
MSENNNQVIMSVDLFNALTNYLTSKPYNEVHQIIAELRQSVQLVDQPVEMQEEPESDE